MLGSLLIVSGASGSGKSTLCRRAEAEGLASYSISCTTRAPRGTEKNGVDYFFLTPAEFDARVKGGEFLEYACVHGNSYGTLREEVVRLLENGKNVVMDIDVQGAASIRACEHPTIRRAFADVFIHVPIEVLEARLRGRSTDSEETIQLRLRNAQIENARRGEYRYILTSGTRKEDYARFKALLVSLGLRTEIRE